MEEESGEDVRPEGRKRVQGEGKSAAGRFRAIIDTLAREVEMLRGSSPPPLRPPLPRLSPPRRSPT
jgi:hypothetical protein